MVAASISQAYSSPTDVLYLTGELDLGAIPDLRRLLQPPPTDAQWNVVVDLSAVTFMDCAGLRPLLETQAVASTRLRFQGLPPQVRRLLALTGLHDAFEVVDGTTPF